MSDVLKVVIDTSVLDQLEREMPGKADKFIGQIAFDVEARAKALMSGGRSGRAYRVPGTSGVMYTASAPGEPPAVVTGALKNSINAKREGKMRWVVTVGAEQAAALEFGYSPRNLAPRPYLRPAIIAATKGLDSKMVKVVVP